MDKHFYTAHLSREQFCALSASDAIAGVHQGLFTAQAYVCALLEQAKAHSGLNALISMNPEYSISQAKKIDDLRASGGILGELAGLVIVVKDNINTLVFPTSAGTAALQYFHPTSNAPALQRLLDAGAIILGKANMHELAFGITSTNFAPFAGSARNPYDLSKIAGGSSGGNAAAIAAGIVPVGLGTDTGGSCRIPAALCGVVGFRPSVGNGGMERRYEEAGIFPISSTRDTIGLLGKSMSDIMLLDNVMRKDKNPSAQNEIESIQLNTLRVGIPREFWENLDASLAHVMQTVLKKLAQSGVEMVDVELSALLALEQEISFPLALHEPLASIPQYLHQSGATHITLENIVAQISSPDVAAIFDTILQAPFKDDYAEVISVKRPKLQALYADVFDTNQLDILLFPTTPAPASDIDAEHGSSSISINEGDRIDTFSCYVKHAGLCTNVGSPSVSIPVGLTDKGLPVGLEIDGRILADDALLRIGQALEEYLA